MKSAVLIDSSVWVEVSRKGGDESLRDKVGALLQTGRAAMTWPVWVELHQGAKGRREEENLSGWREVSRWLEFDDACWSRAAVTARARRSASGTVVFCTVCRMTSGLICRRPVLDPSSRALRHSVTITRGLPSA